MRILAYILFIALASGLAHAVPIPDWTGKSEQPTFDIGDIDISSAEGPPFNPVLEALQQRDLELARTRIAPLLKSHPNHPGTMELQATIKLAEDNASDAEALLRRASALAPEQATILTKLGIALLAQSRPDEAEAQFYAAVTINPSDALARRFLGDFAERRGDVNSAIEHYERAVAGQADFTPVHARLANLLLATGALDALEALLAPHVGSSSDPGPYLLLARGRTLQGDLQGARALLAQAGLHQAQPAQLAFYGALIDRLEGKLASSEDQLRALTEADPTNAFFHYELAVTQVALGRPKDAGVSAKQAASLVDAAHGIRVDAAGVLVEIGDATAALDVLEPVLKEAPNAWAYVIATRAAFGARQLDRAKLLSERIVAAYPNYLPGYQLHVQVLEQIGQSASARAVAEQATKRFPQAPEAWINRAGILIGQQRYDEAAVVLKNGLERHSQNLQLQFQLATVEQARGRLAQAEEIYQRLLAHEVSRPASLNNLAMLLVEDPERRADAVKYAEEAYRLAPNSASVEDTLGWVLLRDGQLDAAVSRLQSAREKAPDDINVACHLGIAYAKRADSDSARTELKRCLNGNPEAKLLREAQSKMKLLAP